MIRWIKTLLAIRHQSRAVRRAAEFEVECRRSRAVLERDRRRLEQRMVVLQALQRRLASVGEALNDDIAGILERLEAAEKMHGRYEEAVAVVKAELQVLGEVKVPLLHSALTEAHEILKTRASHEAARRAFHREGESE